MSTFNVIDGNCRRCAFSSSYVPIYATSTGGLFRKASDLNDALHVGDNLRDMACSLNDNSKADNSVNSCITDGKSPSFSQTLISARAVQSTEKELQRICDRFTQKVNEENHNSHSISDTNTLSDFVIGSHYQRESYFHCPYPPRGNTNDSASAAAISFFHPASIIRARSHFRIRTKSMSSSGICSNISIFIYCHLHLHFFFILFCKSPKKIL